MSANTAAFVHDMPDGAISNVDGRSDYVRVQVLTNAGALDRDKQLAVVERLSKIGVASRTQAVLWGVRHGFTPDHHRIDHWRGGP